MKRLLLVFILLLGGLFVLAGCDDPKPSSNPQQQVNSQQPQATTAPNPIPAKPIEIERIAGVNITKPDFDPNIAEDTSIMLVIDGSGSMNERDCSGNISKMDLLKKSIGEYLNTLPENTWIGLYAFEGGRPSLRIKYTKDKETVKKAIQAIQPSGGTPLYTSLQDTEKLALTRYLEQGKYGRHMILIITDGESNDVSTKGPFEQLIKPLVNESGVELHVIGFCTGTNLLAVPGYVHWYDASSPQALKKAFDELNPEKF